MKELVKHFKEQPKEAIKEVVMCVSIFAVCGAMLILQGCSVSKGVTIRGKATIVTTDTTVVKHNGALKFKKSMFNK